MRRRSFIARAAFGVAALSTPYILRAQRSQYDLILRGGNVIDGRGRGAFVADVGVSSGRFVSIQEKITEIGRSEIDCRGLVVAPGFIDIHTHIDGTLFQDPLLESVVRQGVTTVVIGADGSSRAPGERSVGELLASISELGPGANVATLVGLGTLRGLVVGNTDRVATAGELERMKSLVEESLLHGALGASSGLEYTPGAFAPIDELIALCAPLASRGLAYHTHMRNEDDRLLDAIEESIAVARGAGCALQISHLKTQGPRNWEKLDRAFDLVASARRAGIDAAFDRYPYVAYQTGLTNLFPVWSRDGGNARFFARLSESGTAERIREETLAKVELIGGWNNVQIASVNAAEDRRAEGERFGNYAESLGQEPYSLAVAMLKRNSGSIGMVGFAMSEENLERILAHEFGMVASDGGAWAVAGPARRGVPHPRGSGSFARVLGRYVRERRALSLESAISKMTSIPGSRIGLSDRGTIEVGSMADVAVFDPDTIEDKATFTDPFQYAVGVKATIVNGKVAFLDGERVERSGVAIRR